MRNYLFIWTLVNYALAVQGATVTGSGNKFVKCDGFLGSSTEICFEAVISEMVVQIGTTGTNDEVILEVCSDVDKKQCCRTLPLKSALSNEWAANSRATLGEAFFGECKEKAFLVKRGLDVTLSKSKEGPLLVKSIDIYTRNPNKKITDLERFQCGGFEIGGSKLPKETKQCKTGPYHYQGIEKMIVQMGPKGTNDKVNVKVCSDTNDVCCETRLSKLLSDDWKQNKKQEWKASDFGECAKIRYKVTNSPVFSINKDGKEDMAVASVGFYMQQQDSNPSLTTTFACEAFNITGDCKQAALCTYTFAKCSPSTGPSIPEPTTTTKSTTTTASTTAKSGGFFSNLFGGKSDTTTTAAPTTKKSKREAEFDI